MSDGIVTRTGGSSLAFARTMAIAKMLGESAGILVPPPRHSGMPRNGMPAPATEPVTRQDHKKDGLRFHREKNSFPPNRANREFGTLLAVDSYWNDLIGACLRATGLPPLDLAS